MGILIRIPGSEPPVKRGLLWDSLQRLGSGESQEAIRLSLAKSIQSKENTFREDGCSHRGSGFVSLQCAMAECPSQGGRKKEIVAC